MSETRITHPAVEQMAKDLSDIELNVLTGFTLADAMREGEDFIDQGLGMWVDKDNACALGTAALVVQARGLSK